MYVDPTLLNTDNVLCLQLDVYFLFTITINCAKMSKIAMTVIINNYINKLHQMLVGLSA